MVTPWIQNVLRGTPMDLADRLRREVEPKHLRRAMGEAFMRIQEETGMRAIGGRWVKWEGSLEETVIKNFTPAEAQASIFKYETRDRETPKTQQWAAAMYARLLERIKEKLGKVPVGDVWI